jgi:hypothetical protein
MQEVWTQQLWIHGKWGRSNYGSLAFAPSFLSGWMEGFAGPVVLGAHGPFLGCRKCPMAWIARHGQQNMDSKYRASKIGDADIWSVNYRGCRYRGCRYRGCKLIGGIKTWPAKHGHRICGQRGPALEQMIRGAAGLLQDRPWSGRVCGLKQPEPLVNTPWLIRLPPTHGMGGGEGSSLLSARRF